MLEIRYLEVKSHSIYISTTLDDAPLKINARLSDITPNLPAELLCCVIEVLSSILLISE